jgi:hypothetical protein
VSPRPLVFVSGLTFADYLLWSWSLNHNHDVLALVSGLTLPPLAVAWVWLVALGLARLIAHLARRPSARVARERRHEPAAGATTRETPATSGSADAPSGKLAA